MTRRLAFLGVPGIVLGAILLLMPSTGRAASAWDLSQQPGAIAIIRHALAPGTGDPANFELGDCSTQRNLNAAGRAQARAIGAAIRAAGIEVDRVLTSQWCRCRETADLLGLGEVEAFPPLNSFYEDRSTAAEQTEQTRAFLAALPDDERVVLVTHQVNITALTGRSAWSGEAVIFEVDQDGRVEVLGEVSPPDPG